MWAIQQWQWVDTPARTRLPRWRSTLPVADAPVPRLRLREHLLLRPVALPEVHLARGLSWLLTRSSSNRLQCAATALSLMSLAGVTAPPSLPQMRLTNMTQLRTLGRRWHPFHSLSGTRAQSTPLTLTRFTCLVASILTSLLRTSSKNTILELELGAQLL